jgi:hypothetical protein
MKTKKGDSETHDSAQVLSAKKLSLNVEGDEVVYFVAKLTKPQLKKFQTKGFQTELQLLSEEFSGNEETSWTSVSSISLSSNGKEISVDTVKAEPLTVDYRGSDIVFVRTTIESSEYSAEILASSAEEVSASLVPSERWVLPDERVIEIRRLKFDPSLGIDLEYQGGGSGYSEGVVITSDGTILELEETEDEDSGEFVIRISGS